MDLAKELKQYESLMSYELLNEFVEKPKEILSDDILAIIPSIQTGDDGPYLVTLILISNNYLCEVRLVSGKEEFDFVAKDSITNFRFHLSDLTITDANKEEIKYQVAEVILVHDVGVTFRTSFHYVGFQRKEWIDNILSALPLSYLIK